MNLLKALAVLPLLSMTIVACIGAPEEPTPSEPTAESSQALPEGEHDVLTCKVGRVCNQNSDCGIVRKPGERSTTCNLGVCAWTTTTGYLCECYSQPSEYCAWLVAD